MRRYGNQILCNQDGGVTKIIIFDYGFGWLQKPIRQADGDNQITFRWRTIVKQTTE